MEGMRGQYDPKVLVEAAVTAREIEVAVLQGMNGTPPDTSLPGETPTASVRWPRSRSTRFRRSLLQARRPDLDQRDQHVDRLLKTALARKPGLR